MRCQGAGPVHQRNRGCDRLFGEFFSNTPSLVTEAGNSFRGIQILEQRYSLIQKCSGKGNTLISLHAEMKVTRGRNFLGSVIAGRSRDEQPGPGWASGKGERGTKGRSRSPGPHRQVGLRWSQQSLALKVGKGFAGNRWAPDAK